MADSPAANEPRTVGWRIVFALAAAALAIYLPAIGVADFVGDDEALDAGVVAEMARTGDWLFPEFNGEYLPPKPPLYYWAARAVSVVHGAVDEASLRIPSALSGAALVGLTTYALAPAQGATTAALGGVILLTMPIMRDQARAGRCDMMLALLVSACLFLARDGWASRARCWLFASLLGLVAITKGGAGVGVVVAALFLYAAAERSIRRLRIFVDPSMLALLVIGGSWYVIGAAHWGARFVDEQIVGENLNHLIGGTAISDRNPGTRSLGYHLGYYPRNLFVTMLPWSLCLPLAAFDAWRRRAVGEPDRFLFAWILAGLVFFTAAARKSPYYLLPIAPAVAAIAAGWLSPKIEQAFAARPLRWPLSSRTLLALLAATIAVWLVAAHLPIGGCRAEAAIAATRDHPFATIGSAWALAAALAAFGIAARGRDWGHGSIALVAALAALWLLVDHVEGRIADCGSLRPFARAVATLAPAESPIFFFRDPLPKVALYAERRIPRLRADAAEPTPPFFLIVPESLRADVPEAWIAASRVVASGRGRVFTRREMGIELLEISPAALP